MQRDIAALAAREFDLIVIGGGIFGAATAWDAAERGLSVALLEQADFGHAASAHCFKMVHGGIRYLQHADLVRLRQSNLERRTLLRIAPHLVRPLPIFIPTYGHGREGKELLAAGLAVYDLLTLDRNRGLVDPARHIPPSRTLSRREALARFPDLACEDLSGGALFYDGQMRNPGRFVLAFVLSAAARGTQVANYTEVTSLLRSGERVVGVGARDVLSGAEFEVRGRVVVNATGGWAPRQFARWSGRALEPAPVFSRDAYFVLRRPWPNECALAVAGATRDPDAFVSRSARHLFLVPWRGCTLVGVWHAVYEGDPAAACLREEDLRSFLEEINGAYPALGARFEDIASTHAGLVLFGDNQPGTVHLSYGKRSRFVDHAKSDGLDGLLTLIGVRFTTARLEAEKAVNCVFRKLARPVPPCRTAATPLFGGDIPVFADFLRGGREERPAAVTPEIWENLLEIYGSRYRDVLALCQQDAALSATLPGSAVLRAEVLHAARCEMAQTLSDVVLRRSELGAEGLPEPKALEVAADILAAELGWGEARRRREIEAVSAEPTLCLPLAGVGVSSSATAVSGGAESVAGSTTSLPREGTS